MAVIEIKNLSFSYNNSDRKILNDINMCIENSEIVLLCGQSGCGKTTLLRHIKHTIAPCGKVSGDIFYNGGKITETDEKILACEIGYVSQSPDLQIVCETVSAELVFGLGNAGVEIGEIKRRTAEIVSYFGMESWYHKNVNKISGGQKQLLNLASILIMRPKLLVLDEPVSQLDPIAADDFIEKVRRLNRDFGVTVIICEHNSEKIFAIADKVCLMESGEILCYDTPCKTEEYILCEKTKLSGILPIETRFCSKVFNMKINPILSLAQAQKIIDEKLKDILCRNEVSVRIDDKNNSAIVMKNVFFRYDKKSDDILKGLTLSVYKGEVLSVIGGNGSGKTTLLSVIYGSEKAYRGKVSINGKTAYMPQNPISMFVAQSVGDDIRIMMKRLNISTDFEKQLINEYLFFHDIKQFYECNPSDLSGGELQRIAFFKIMLIKPDIILLDEPTKGLDCFAKEELAVILSKLKSNGICVILVTHDIDFAAEYSDRCAMLFDGEIICADTPQAVFSLNDYYTTSVNRLVKKHLPKTVTWDGVMKICGL